MRPLDEQARIFDHLRAAEALAERLGDDQRLGLIASYLCVYFMVRGEHDYAIAAGQRTLALATTSGALDLQIAGQTPLSLVYHTVGDFWQALDIARQTVALLTGARRSGHFGQVVLPAVNSHGIVAWCLAELGDFAEGRGVRKDAVRLAEVAERPLSMAAALLFVGLLYQRQGDVHQAIPALERSLAVSQAANILMFFPLTASSLGAAYALAGRVAEALPLLDQMLEHVATGSRMLFHAYVLTELSEALLRVGRVEDASAVAGRLLELSHTHTGSGYQAHVYRLLGEVALRRDPPGYRPGYHPLPPSPGPR